MNDRQAGGAGRRRPLQFDERVPMGAGYHSAPAGTARVVTALLIAGVIGLVTGAAIFLSGFKPVPVGKVALHYDGGPLEGERFVSVVPPGTGTRFYGFFDRLYELPATQRNYIMSKAPDQNASGTAEYVGA
ncbi:MAG TPA: hypothetical protein VGV86_11350, partial [Acidimicrobiales bacterium]|nr:hypothetical protein [Acidimicrobiales bacterium]